MVQINLNTDDQGVSSPVPQSILKHFDLSPAVYPWTDERVHETRGRRSDRKELFMDKLLGLAGVEPTLYPPTTLPSLRRLLGAILTSDFDRLKRDCLLYYLLLDYASPTDRKRADSFARQRCVPKMWTCFVQGYWELDNGLWESAVVHLSDPRLIPDFIPEVLETLATLPPPELSATLVRRYILFTDPPLSTARERDIKLNALCEADLVKAWEYMREVRGGSLNIEDEEEDGDDEDENEMEDVKRADKVDAEAEADRMLRGILDHSLIPSPRPQALSSLLNLPLTHHEHTQLIAYLNRPSPAIPHASMSILHDLVTLRLIHQGRYAEGIQLDRDLAASASGGESDRQRRREMVRDLVAVLPEVQRNILLVDRDEQEDLSSSWEVVQPSSSTPALPNGQNKNGSLPLSATDAFRASTRPNDAVLHALVQNQPQSVSHIRELSAANPTVAALASAIPLPSSPGISSAAARAPHSPFAGPPRFANGHAASPRKPSAAATSTPTPTPMPAPVARRLPSASVSVSGRSASPAPSATPAPPVFKPVKTRHFGWGESSATPTRAEREPLVDARGAFDAASDMEEGENAGRERSPTPTPEPEPEPKLRKSTRKGKGKASEAETSPTPATPRTTRARSTRQASAAPALPAVEEKEIGSMPGALPDSDLGRSRIRRSASRALLETDEEDSKRGGKRSKATSTPAPAPVRRSARNASVQGSEMGSPTPSVTKTPSRRKTRATSIDETPRAGGMKTRRQASVARDD